jgi:hypothetical protein
VITNGGGIRIWKEMVVVYFMVAPRPSPEEIEQPAEIPQFG